MFFLLMEFLFSKIVKFYKNLKYGSSGLSGLYVEARQHFLGYRDMLIWHVKHTMAPTHAKKVQARRKIREESRLD